MPMQVCAARPRCGNLVDRGYCATCKAKGEGKETRPNANERGYTFKWQKYSAGRLARHPLCEGLRLQPGGPVVVNTHPGRVAAAVVTDHIVPHKGDQKLMWDKENHQSGCKDCHDVKTARFDGGFGRGVR